MEPDADASGAIPNSDLMVSNNNAIRVSAGVETGTDVPARGNGLISCRHFPPGPSFPPSDCFSVLCDNGGGGTGLKVAG